MQNFDQAQADFKRDMGRYTELTANLSEAKLGARVDVIEAARDAVLSATAAVNQAQWYLSKRR
ncbi:MAG: hypothetical protein HWD59_09700 [Coxiellaceae bacterium]|nr:MAG: hypothetical protein HWD59_09700 [Coxiellaceae bacterium]